MNFRAMHCYILNPLKKEIYPNIFPIDQRAYISAISELILNWITFGANCDIKFYFDKEMFVARILNSVLKLNWKLNNVRYFEQWTELFKSIIGGRKTFVRIGHNKVAIVWRKFCYTNPSALYDWNIKQLAQFLVFKIPIFNTYKNIQNEIFVNK